MILRGITLARSWHVLVRIGITTIAVAAATALQLPAKFDVPGQPFLLYFVIVVASASAFGRTLGFLAVAETTIASVLYFDPVYSLRLTHAVDLLAIEIYSVVAAISVEAFCRLVNSALAEKSDANSARINLRETGHRLANDLAAVAAILGGSKTGSADIKSLMAELRETAARRKASEDLLRNSERQLHLVTDKVPLGIVHCDAEVRYKFINKHHAERLGLAPEQVIGKRVQEVIDDKIFAIAGPYVRECLAGKAVKFEVEVRDPAGEPQIMRCCFEPEWTDGKVVGFVAASINISDLKRAEAALRESEATFRAMFEVSSVGKIEVEPKSGRFLRANAAMCKFVGYSEAELLARTVFDITHPDDRDHDRELLRRMVTGELSVFDAEKRYIRKDGNAVWARVTANIIRDESGRPLRDTAVVQDITARKEREEKEHLLMREVNHRAKNMLSVVQAIAHQTATRNPEDFVERFSDRIQALSANQDLLVRNEWNGVDIEDLVHAQLAHFTDLIGSRIAVHGPKLRLTAAAAQAIGLALHELATNAGKYGALSTDTGRVDISWGIEGYTFTMSWIERDGPPVSAPEQCGFGTIVIETMAERSVGGTVDLDYAPSGVTWRLTCPAANALEHWEREPIREGKIELTARLAKSSRERQLEVRG